MTEKSKNNEHTIDDKVKDAHCYYNGQLHYKTTIHPNDVSISEDAKKYAGFCCLEDERCPYHQLYKNTHYCNLRLLK